MRRAAATYTLLSVLQRGLVLLLLPALARAMSVDEFGIASILTAGNLLLVALLGGAIEQAVTRASAHTGHGDERATLAAARLWLLYLAPIIALFVSAVIWIVGEPFLAVPAPLWSIEVAAAGIAVFGLAYAVPRLRALRRVRAFAVVTGVAIVTTLAGKLGLVVVAGLGATGWALSDLVTAVAVTITAVTIFRHELADRSGDARSLARFALPLVPHVVALWALSFLTRPLLTAVTDLNQIGLYAMAYNAANAGLILAIELNRVLQVEYARDRLPGPGPEASRAVGLQLLAAVALPVLVCLATPLFVSVLLPRSYEGIQPLLAVLSLMPFVWTFYAISTNVTIHTSKITGWTWTNSLVGVIVTIVGTLWLGSILGGMGAAVTNVLAQLSMAITAYAVLRGRHLEFSFRTGGLTIRWALAAIAALTLAVVPTALGLPLEWWLPSIGLALVLVAIAGIPVARRSAF